MEILIDVLAAAHTASAAIYALVRSALGRSQSMIWPRPLLPYLQGTNYVRWIHGFHMLIRPVLNSRFFLVSEAIYDKKQKFTYI